MLLLYRGSSFDPNFYYRSGIDLDHSFLLVTERGKILIVPRLNESLARAEFKGKVVVSTDPLKTLGKFIRKKKVFADFNALSALMAQRLRKLCTLVDYSQEFLHERAEKKKAEVGVLAKAARHTREVFDSLDFKAAKTEMDLKKQILVKTADMGLEPAFDPIVATGRNSSFPHYCAGKTKLGRLVLIDYGVRYEHYCADMTRCFILNDDNELKEKYEKLQNICHSLADEVPDLRNGRQLAVLADKLMNRNGFPELIHPIGHGIGLAVHEFPRLNKKSDDSLAKTVFTLEPAFYLRQYGMRFEEMIHFDGKKARIL